MINIWIADIKKTRTENDEIKDKDQHQHTPEDIVQHTLATNGANLIRHIIQQTELRTLKPV
jgi:hypothetical protein